MRARPTGRTRQRRRMIIFARFFFNDISALKKMSRSGVAGVKDKLGWTPLHFAALYGSADAVRILLYVAPIRDAQSWNQEQRPLLFAAYKPGKNAAAAERALTSTATANDSSTPLWVAAGADGNEATIRYLLQAGASPKALHDLEEDYLVRAAGHQNAGVLGLLDRKGPRSASCRDEHRRHRAEQNCTRFGLTNQKVCRCWRR